ncbi:c6 zinc finger domain-containing protein [Thozetella sp. PMI_491]|nr:c6 zinc finger domain-containing protein [Thozetella sp. PMI_491]
MSSTASVAGASAGGAKPQRILACVLCQHRKIKCDRHFPCSNCTKANVKCTPSTPAPARKRRRPNQDLQERLARCEELLKEYATTDKPDQPASTPTQMSAYDDPYLKWQPKGKLVKEDGGVRFMDSFLLGTVYDELKAMRDIIEDEDEEENSPDALTPDDNSDLLLGGESPSQNPEDLWPEPAQVFRLWQIYLDKVNPLTKIIHVPSLQPFLAIATTGSHNVPKNIEALLFSIFLMAVVSSSDDECTLMLGYSKNQAIQRFSAGVRLSLMRMGFLKTHDLTTLQALVIYQISLQGRYNRHAAWIMNGVVVRIAQKMGLHRDGEILGLGPFESEMRRRLWWQIIMLDAKYAMLSGLSHSLLPRSWDTREPKNLNDADLHPSATDPLQDRSGPTEMIFCLICYRVVKFMTQTPGFETMILAGELEAMEEGPDGPAGAQQMKMLRQTLETLARDLLDILEKYCDPAAGPVHQMAIQMKDHILDKLNDVITPPREQPEWGSEVLTPKDNAFKVAIGALEHNIQNYTSSMNKGFLWWSLLHFQVDVFVFLVGQLCLRKEGSLVERAWAVVEGIYSFHQELFDVSNKTYFTLSLYILKAWRKREDVLVAKGEIPSTPFYIERLQEVMPHDDSKTESTPTEDTPSRQMGQMDLSPYVPKGINTPDPALDQLLTGFLDPASLEWGDMFNMSMAIPMNADQTAAGQATMGFGYGVPPTTEW